MTTLRGITPAWLSAIAAEIDARAPAKVRAVHQDDRFRFRVALDASDGRADIVIDLDPDFPRMHLDAPAKAPPEPSALAASMRNLLQGARFEGAATVSGERAAALRFTLRGAERTLWIELFGRQANVYVLDEEDVVRVTCRGEVAKTRAAAVGDTFEPVPARKAPENDAAPEPGRSASAQLVERYEGESEQRSSERSRAMVRRALKKKQRTLGKRLTQLQQARDGGAEADELRRRGELLRGSFHLLRPGLEQVTVLDYESDPPREVEVPLRPGLEPGEQVAWCFRRERKLRAAAERAGSAIDAVADAVSRVERALAALDQLDDEDALTVALATLDTETRTHIEAALRPQTPKRQPAKAAGYRAFVSLDGWPIWVGRNARESDALTLRIAKPGDLFLHVRGAPGSHVIVPTPRGKTVPKDTLLDAAQLACLFSKRREAEHNEVDYVERRYVRKPKSAAPGLVTVERAKTLTVRLDAARRARLQASRPRA